jgi:hypothetical protein
VNQNVTTFMDRHAPIIIRRTIGPDRGVRGITTEADRIRRERNGQTSHVGIRNLAAAAATLLTDRSGS